MSPRRKQPPADGPGGGRITIAWTDRARRDLVGIADFIARDKPGAARDWVRQLIAAVEDAALMPLAGRVVPEIGRREIREVLRRNYRIVYRVDGTAIVVLTVFDGRRLLRSIGPEPESDGT
jgi:plasmid stabilization system protein ParE